MDKRRLFKDKNEPQQPFRTFQIVESQRCVWKSKVSSDRDSRRISLVPPNSRIHIYKYGGVVISTVGNL